MQIYFLQAMTMIIYRILKVRSSIFYNIWFQLSFSRSMFDIFFSMNTNNRNIKADKWSGTTYVLERGLKNQTDSWSRDDE